MKKNYIIVSLIISMILIIGYSSVSANSSYFDTSKAVKESIEVIKDDKIIAKVNGIPITKKEYKAVEVYFRKTKKENVPMNDIIKYIAKQELLLKEAKDAGISVSKAEVDDQIKFLKEVYNQANEEEKSRIEDVARGQGITLQQMWSDPKYLKIYEKNLYISKFREKLRKELPVSEQEMHTSKANKLLEEKINKMVDSAKIEIIENANE